MDGISTRPSSNEENVNFPPQKRRVFLLRDLFRTPLASHWHRLFREGEKQKKKNKEKEQNESAR